MTADPIDWRRVAELVAARLGLHFPDARLGELRRGFAVAAMELGFPDVETCAREFLAARVGDEGINVIVSHLAIGETYFFRGEETFAALADHVIPALMAARRRGERCLRIWSAGCCTGEEAYSLAILLRQVLPDIDDRHITILATDINIRSLERAAEGVYGPWSFRGTRAALRERWFRRRDDGRYQIAPEIRRMVRFAPLNLVGDGFLSAAVDVGPMDLVLCRNVLMYFTPAQASRAVAGLHASLREDGWLVVAPCEVSQPLFARFKPVMLDGAILYQRGSAAGHRQEAGGGRDSTPTPTPRLPALPPSPVARRAPSAGRTQSGSAVDIAALARGAYDLANRGRLAEALDCCDRWIAGDKMSAQAHYLRAVVLIERGDPVQARPSLQRSLYLAPEVAMTSFAAGNLELALGHRLTAARHYRNTLELLDRVQPDAALPHSEGVTAKQLHALVRSLLQEKPVDVVFS